MDGIWLKLRIIDVTTPITVARETQQTRTSAKPSLFTCLPLRKTGSLKYPLTSLFANNHSQFDAVVEEDSVLDHRIENSGPGENWVSKVRSFWNGHTNQMEVEDVDNLVENENEDSMEQVCDACRVDDDDDAEFDKNSFSKLLQKVSLAEARLYAKMSYLGNLSYTIPKIKPGNLLKRHRLRFITTSLEKKAEVASKAKASNGVQQGEEDAKRMVRFQEDEQHQENTDKSDGNLISAFTAYRAAASYLHSHTKNVIPFKSSENSKSEGDMENAEASSSMMVTAIAVDEVKQAVADDMSSTCSSPCEWFICDDDESKTRYFVIQGSESLQSWQANIIFEPIQFEATDVIVHRGIYEAAKGLYEEILPHVLDHIRCHGHDATIRLTGHSLGGSLSLLVNLMLLIRGQVPPSSLLPVVTFGAPWVICGGDGLLHKLGLPRSHLLGITLHRDIVPRLFSCNYPSRVAYLLKAVNGNFRNHPCLNNQNVLYAPMGELLILQPDAKVSPSHHLLPSGSGLYVLRCEKQRGAAQSVFLNTPHPLEILRDRCAYGSEGAIQRDHDMETYITAIRSVIRQELNQVRRMRRDHRPQYRIECFKRLIVEAWNAITRI